MVLKLHPCETCAHYIEGRSCTAFGYEGIPLEIYMGLIEHTEPYGGDMGLVYTPKSNRVSKARTTHCPPGQHRHPPDKYDYCHPINRRHRDLGGSTGDPKADEALGYTPQDDTHPQPNVRVIKDVQIPSEYLQLDPKYDEFSRSQSPKALLERGQISREEFDAVESYMGTEADWDDEMIKPGVGSSTINRFLRYGKPSSYYSKEEIMDAVDRLDRVIEATEPIPPMTLYRGITEERMKQLVKDGAFIDDAYMSTSACIQAAEFFSNADERSYILKLDTEPNLKGLPTNWDVNSSFAEKELLFGRGKMVKLLFIEECRPTDIKGYRAVSAWGFDKKMLEDRENWFGKTKGPVILHCILSDAGDE